ncbi:MAG TPA: SAM-dependent chlorinase/fluorinase [Steroidobacteraceae bacterium]
MSAFRPCGVVTLTTDFGLEDPFVGVMKGRIVERFPAARVIDLTHAIPPQAAAEAGFWLSRSFEYFPEGTVHVAVVDPGVGTDRAIVCVATRGHALIAPDNGLLAPVVARAADSEISELAPSTLSALGIRSVSATFHGRDIFAPVAAELAAGRLAPSDLGKRRSGLTQSPLEERGLPDGPGTPSAAQAGHSLSGRVVTIDHFGNLITDIDSSRLAPLRDPHVTIGGRVVPYRRTYGEVRQGELVALVNSFDALEIALAEGSAAATLGVGRGAPVLVWSSPLPVERNPL